jgi:alkylation response protein AidB-like acyl-CoA dehydrogenase
MHMLRDEVRKFLVKEVAAGPVAHADGTSGRHDAAAVWRGLAGLGATALMLPDDCGGAGLGAMELCVVAEESAASSARCRWPRRCTWPAQALLSGATAESAAALAAGGGRLAQSAAWRRRWTA